MNDKLISQMPFRNVGFASVRELSFGFCRKVQVFRKGYLCSLLFALAFLVLAFPVSAQPAMSRGEQRLSINYDECIRRAEYAFTNEGWVNIGKGGAFVNAFKENHGAYIMCNVAPENKMWVNIVVASLSQDTNIPGAERVKLQKWMDQPVGNAPSGACGLGRVWDIVESGNQMTWTRQGNSSVFQVNGTVNGNSFTAEQTITVTGNKVMVDRYKAIDGNLCRFEGTIQSDGVTVIGTYDCTKYKPSSGWRAKINCN